MNNYVMEALWDAARTDRKRVVMIVMIIIFVRKKINVCSQRAAQGDPFENWYFCMVNKTLTINKKTYTRTYTVYRKIHAFVFFVLFYVCVTCSLFCCAVCLYQSRSNGPTQNGAFVFARRPVCFTLCKGIR